eukprot:TRINITY_DN8854_c0_g1_i2.p2 TRINITY_DN8854_c0_g1~~TRINITY_DN8854_c0_g1_i2.p2  ORF type:complete len:136 (+),score=4.84 TRINITY_DN8854_c0_g1_i2:103-510(+)
MAAAKMPADGNVSPKKALAASYLAVACLVAAMVASRALGAHEMICFGGRFGTFGGHAGAQPFFEFQVQDDSDHYSRFQTADAPDIGYVFGMENLLHELQTPYQHLKVYAHRYAAPLMRTSLAKRIKQVRHRPGTH